jgi:hypothetical protein
MAPFLKTYTPNQAYLASDDVGLLVVEGSASEWYVTAYRKSGASAGQVTGILSTQAAAIAKRDQIISALYGSLDFVS